MLIRILTESESQKFLKRYGISIPKAILARNKKEALLAAEKIKYPVVLKVMSREIIHKSDAGCVMANIKNPAELSGAFLKILRNAKSFNPKAKISGVLVEELLGGAEVMIGAKKDPQFGHILVFALGGKFVEILKDSSIRLAPIEKKEARAMIKELKGYKILRGCRGEAPANLEKIEDALLKVSKMVSENPQISEMDINPLFAGEKNAVVGDARIIFE